MPAMNVFAAVLNLISSFVALVPILWQVQRGNVGTCAFAIWASLGCLSVGVNAVLWHDNVLDVAPAWCDISTRTVIAASVGLPAATVVITRQLYRSTSLCQVIVQERERRVLIITDLCICFGFPFIAIALYYVVQKHRYDVYEEFGCMPAMTNTALTYCLVFIWPVVLGLYSTIMCPYIIHALLAQRVSMANFASANQTRMYRNFVRLVILTCTVALLSLPLGFIAAWVFAAKSGELIAWPGMSFAHREISNVDTVCKDEWVKGAGTAAWLYWHQWIFPFAAFLLFSFFGVTEEARTWYGSIVRRCANMPALNSRGRKRKNSIAPEIDNRPPPNDVIDIRPSRDLPPLPFSPCSPPEARIKLQYSPRSFVELSLYDIREDSISPTSTPRTHLIGLSRNRAI